MLDVLRELKAAKGKILILTHHNADIDAVSSALALQAGLMQLGLSASIGVAESIARAARQIAVGAKILVNPDCASFDTVILVETSVPEQLAGVKNLRADIIVDHHPPGPLVKRAKAVWIETKARSSAQMIYALLKEMGCKIDKELAKIIAAGIVADTAHLRLARAEEFDVLLKLLRTGLGYSDVLAAITTPPDRSEIIACLKAATRAQLFGIDKLILAISKVKSHEAAAARGLLKLGADIAIVAAVKEAEVRISSRSKEKVLQLGIDLAEIFAKIGEIIGGTGGGHALAGSANGPNVKAADAALNYALKTIAKKLSKPFRKLE
jgi:phosphoesterase RecJ-like protein